MANQKDLDLFRKVLPLKDLNLNNLIVIGVYNGVISKSKLEMHVHEGRLEIIYLDTGYQTYIVGNEEFHLKGGDVFITFPNEKHGSGQYLQGKGIIYWFQINMTLINGSFLCYQQEEAEIFVNKILGISKRHFAIHAEFKKILDEIFAVGSEGDSPLLKLKIYSLASQVLLSIIEAAKSSKHENKSNEILKSINYINTNIDQDISVEALAEHVHLSSSHFKNKFKVEIGTSPADFVQRQKIIKSEKLLHDANLSITDIAYSLSYSSSQHFSTVFKKYTGKSPTEFRKK